MRRTYIPTWDYTLAPRIARAGEPLDARKPYPPGGWTVLFSVQTGLWSARRGEL